MSKTTIIAIDPGFDRLGWAVGRVGKTAHDKTLLAYGLIATDRAQTHYERFADLSRQLDEILAEYCPQEAAMEKLFFTSNQKTVMAVAEARGVIMSCFFRAGTALAEYTPPQIKLAVTGFGRADKVAVEKMVRLELKLGKELEIIDDTIDALALLLMQMTAGSGDRL